MWTNFFFNNIFMNRFLIPSSSVCIPFLFNWIWIQYNLIQLLNWIYLNWNPNSMYLNLIQLFLNWIIWISIQFQFNLICMQCHLIFSFEWNLIFTKSIHFFINWIVDCHW
jgi:hypothetical protein